MFAILFFKCMNVYLYVNENGILVNKRQCQNLKIHFIFRFLWEGCFVLFGLSFLLRCVLFMFCKEVCRISVIGEKCNHAHLCNIIQFGMSSVAFFKSLKSTGTTIYNKIALLAKLHFTTFVTDVHAIHKFNNFY